MAIKVFAKGLMASEDVQSYVGSCRFATTESENNYAAIYDGAFVNIGNIINGDYNVHYAVAPAAGALTREDVCVIDLADINEATVQGNVMKIGGKLVDLELAAGYTARFRRLKKGDKFWLGEGCFDSAPTLGSTAIAEAGKTTLKVDNPAANELCVKVIASKAMTVGQTVYAKTSSTWEQYFLVEVM